VTPSVGNPKTRSAPSSTYQLVAAEPGSLEALTLHGATRRAPGPDEVEIRVSASGLNFIDVLKAMGVYPGVTPTTAVALGAECAGTVVAVGAEVTDLAVRDEVVAITPDYAGTGLLASHVTVPAAFVARRPDAVPPESAAALPVAYVTAYYALHELARVRPGERVLIHSATGGTGLAALHVCRWLGAEVLATAGTQAKRDHLRSLGVDAVFDSRRDTFAAELLEHTGGRGVDVVLNSLAGNAIDAGLHALAPGGRFVEIGKRDVYAHRHVDLASFKDNRALFVVDIAALTALQPDYVAGIFHRVVDLVARGDLPLLPATGSPIDAAADAFRTMAQGQHVGKLVLTAPAAPPLVAVGAVHGDGTYVITGGLGALGLAVAERFAQRGAGTLVLLGRSEPSDGAAQTIDRMRRLGADVRVVLADVTDRVALMAALDAVRASAPPMRGVVHAAGVLADATLDQMDRARLDEALAPKVTGGGNVHAATLDDPLDFFVLFASVAGVLGLAGQANYAAANAYLDALAHHRRALGRPALSIDWGPWADVGLASTRADRGDRLAGRGLGGLGTDEALDVLENLLDGDRAQACVMRLDRARWIEGDPAAAALLGAPNEGDTAAAATGNLRDHLSSIPAGPARRRAVEETVCGELAPVLRLAADRIERDRPFKALGLDSLMALELRNRLEARTGLTLPATIAWNHPTVAQLAIELARRLLPVTDDGVEPAALAPADDAATDVDAATAQELQALLDDELAAVERLLGAEGRSS
jgi:NADPH:quinone reductase-like Zn-dependent oxidoreductase/acyl carrier protein